MPCPLGIRQRAGCCVLCPSASRIGQARRAGHIPWTFTLDVYPGRTLVCQTAQIEAAARQHVKLTRSHRRAGRPWQERAGDLVAAGDTGPTPRPGTHVMSLLDHCRAVARWPGRGGLKGLHARSGCCARLAAMIRSSWRKHRVGVRLALVTNDAVELAVIAPTIQLGRDRGRPGHAAPAAGPDREASAPLDQPAEQAELPECVVRKSGPNRQSLGHDPQSCPRSPAANLQLRLRGRVFRHPTSR